MPRNPSTRRRVLKFGGAALSAGLAGCNATLPSLDLRTEQPSGTGKGTPSETASPGSSTSEYTEVYRDAISSVVMVRTTRGQGTGFFYDDSHIVTNAHVVGQTTSTQLRFHGGSWSQGSVKGTDIHSDLAVIAADSAPNSVQPLTFAEDPPVIGQKVVAIGNPYNLDGSVTSGIISGLDRLIASPAGYQIPDAIQTDAAVNPGNSGGPLMALDRSVLGVVNSKSGDNIAFGISAALTQRVVPQLIEEGEYDHAYMGVSLETVTPTIADANGLESPRGLLVVQTVRSGPADGVLQSSDIKLIGGEQIPVGGDVILKVEDILMDSFEDLASYLALQTRPGDTIQLTVLRDGETKSVGLQLGSRPEASSSPLQ